MIFTGEIKDKYDIVRVTRGTSIAMAGVSTIDWLERSINVVESFSPPRAEAELFFSDLTVHS